MMMQSHELMPWEVVPVYINCRDRLGCLQRQLAWLEQYPEAAPVIIDCASTYPPLLEFYLQTEVPVVRCGNLGPRAAWKSGEIHKRYAPFFVVVDCDVVPDENCPKDVFVHMRKALQIHPHWNSVGLGLRIDDLPECYVGREEVLRIEGRHWEHELEPGWFEAPIDSGNMPMFRWGQHLLYGDRQIMTASVPMTIEWIDVLSISEKMLIVDRPGYAYLSYLNKTRLMARSGPPYVARHTTWYLDSANLPEDERWYSDHLDPNSGVCWSVNFKE